MPPSCPCPLPTSSAQDNSDAQLGLLFVNTQQWGPHGPATVGAFQFMGFSFPGSLGATRHCSGAPLSITEGKSPHGHGAREQRCTLLTDPAGLELAQAQHEGLFSAAKVGGLRWKNLRAGRARAA